MHEHVKYARTLKKGTRQATLVEKVWEWEEDEDDSNVGTVVGDTGTSIRGIDGNIFYMIGESHARRISEGDLVVLELRNPKRNDWKIVDED